MAPWLTEGAVKCSFATKRFDTVAESWSTCPWRVVWSIPIPVADGLGLTLLGGDEGLFRAVLHEDACVGLVMRARNPSSTWLGLFATLESACDDLPGGGPTLGLERPNADIGRLPAWSEGVADRFARAE